MPAVGYTPIDVAREFQHRVAKLEPVVAAFLQYDQRGNRLTVTTLMENFDHAAEDQLASVEVFLNHTFEDYAFDFSTIHLQGRDPSQFMPAEGGSLMVFDRTGRNRQAEPRRVVG